MKGENENQNNANDSDLESNREEGSSESLCGDLEHDCCRVSKAYDSLSSKFEKVVLQNKALENALKESRDGASKMTSLTKSRIVRQCVNSLLAIDDISSTLLSMLSVSDNNNKLNVLDVSIINSVKVMSHHVCSTLKKFEVETVAPNIGETFNPELHMAISTVGASEEHKQNTVVKVLHTGCILEGKIIRPAAVIVAI